MSETATMSGLIRRLGGLACLLLLALSTAGAMVSADPGAGAVAFTYYQGQWSRLPDFDLETPAGSGLAAGFVLGPIPLTQDFAVRYQGFIDVPSAGEYRFYTRSDDGSALSIDGVRVVDNDGLHADQIRWGNVTLGAGRHAIAVDFFQRGGNQILEVGWQDPAGLIAPLDPARLAVDPEALPAPLAPDLPAGTERIPGVAYDYFEGDWSRLPDFTSLEPVFVGSAPDFDLNERLRPDRFAFRFQGWLEVPEDGIYTFFTASDDGSALSIGDRRIVDNDGLHGHQERSGTVLLQAGWHRITVDFFEKSGGETLLVSWSGPGLAKTRIPVAALSHSLDMLPPLKAPDVPSGALNPGLAYRWYAGDWLALPDFDNLVPDLQGISAGFDLNASPLADRFGFSFRGYLNVPANGVYRFYTTSDAGSALHIGDRKVVDNNGLWSPRTAFGTIALAAGVHAIRVDFFETWGGQTLTVEYRTPDGQRRTLPPDALFHTADQLPALREPPAVPSGRSAGLAYAYYEGDWANLDAMLAASPRAHGVTPAFSLDPRARNDRFGFVYSGWIDLTEDGPYRFWSASDDGSRVWIDDTLVVDNDGPHALRLAYGSIGLKAGLHRIRVAFFESTGDEVLQVGYRTPGGNQSELAPAILSHTADQLPALTAAQPLPATARPGLAWRYYEGSWDRLPDFSAIAPAGLGLSSGISLATAAGRDRYGLRFTGWLQVPADGFYDLYTNSDEGSRLWIGDRLVVDNDGLHAARDAVGNIGLAAGWHPIRIEYFDRWGDDSLAVSWRGPGSGRTPIPAGAFAVDPTDLPPLEAPDAARDHLIGGIDYAYFEGNWSVLPDFAALTPTARGQVAGFSLAPRRKDDYFAFRFSGYIDIPEYGVYTFYTTSDDGSRLSIGGQVVVNNDGLHGAREATGRIALERGRHAITLDYFERTGDAILSVAYAGPRFAKQPILAGDLFRLDPVWNGDPGDPGPPEGPSDPAANRAPLPTPDSAATGIGAGQSVALNVLANDTDPDGDHLALAGISAAGAAGAALVDPNSGQLRYFPPLGFVGQDLVRYAVSDRRGQTAWGEVRISVGAGQTPLLGAAEAVRLLTQATFGPAKAEIAELMVQGPEAWIDAQLALPASTHASAVAAMAGAPQRPGNRDLRLRAWLDRALTAPDQLRQRVAFALSQILVISDQGNDLATSDGAFGAVDYYDLLVEGAFGNYRDLLERVTLHPAMGLFLNMAGNRKADPLLGTVPDENYAREILQLFSLGLWQLGPDGQRVLDAAGQPRPTYTQTQVMEFAKVFTGWDFAAAAGPDRYRLPLRFDPALHEDGPKILLGGVLLPAGQGGPADLAQTLDNITAHPNLAPFIVRQLIQRLVTSNPSPAYIARAAAAFSDNGLALGAAVRAILLDPEARTAEPDPLAALAVLPGPAFGKVREPLLQLTALWRGLGLDAPTAWQALAALQAQLGQAPLAAPSVFNFFKPDYQHPGQVSELGLYAPELELINERQVTGSGALIDDWTLGGIDGYDLTQELAVANAGADKLLDHLDLLLRGGRMSAAMRQILREEVLTWTGEAAGVGNTERLTPAMGAIFLILTSPEFLIQE